MEEGKLSKEEANEWVGKRNFYLNNIVLDDGSIYKPKIKGGDENV
jgi:pyrroloquinoline quinone (PQQ) biosynthesis protein C